MTLSRDTSTRTLQLAERIAAHHGAQPRHLSSEQGTRAVQWLEATARELGLMPALPEGSSAVTSDRWDIGAHEFSGAGFWDIGADEYAWRQ